MLDNLSDAATQPVDLPEIIRVWTLLQSFPKEGKTPVRRFDGTTPLALHSVHAMSMIGLEAELPSKVRYFGARVLLWHDVAEDTSCGLPPDLDQSVAHAVQEMSFSGFDEEQRLIWYREPLSWLFKLYDKVSNLWDGFGRGGWMEKRGEIYQRKYLTFTEALLANVEREILPRWTMEARAPSLRIAEVIRSFHII